MTPGDRSSPSSRLKVLTSMTTPPSPCGHLERGVADLARLLLEDRADQLLLGGQLGLALRRDLADEQVAGADLGADADDAAVVEVAERLLRAVRDVAGDLLVAELRRAGVDLVLVDVDRGEHLVLHEPLRDDDRVLEVVALERHERDEQVRAERELAVVGRGAVGQDRARHHLVAELHDRLVVDERALVRAHELDQVVLVARALALDDDAASRRARPRCRRLWRRRRRPSRPRRGTRGRCRRAAPAGSSAARPAAACSRP